MILGSDAVSNLTYVDGEHGTGQFRSEARQTLAGKTGMTRQKLHDS